MSKLNRRNLVKWLGTGMALSQLPLTGSLALGADTDNDSPRLVWIVLRGAMDSLHTVIPAFDDHLMPHREVIAAPAIDTMLPLDRGFGLNAELKTLHSWYQTQQMMPVVAVASPYRQRSHFDGQDILESALTPVNQDNGWLSRALSITGKKGLAIAQSLPISLRGHHPAGTWYPSQIPSAKEDLYQRLFQMYEQDEQLHQRLEEALETRAMVGNSMESNRNRRFVELARSAGVLMKDTHSPDAIMLEMGGWDTHDNQHARLTRQFRELDEGLQAMKTAMGDKAWSRTMMIIATEFGRTVVANGTRGTDHGTASCLFLAGGAIKSGKTLGEWPGLGKNDLYQQRDLRPTSDIRQWISSILIQHWQLSGHQLNQVFPGVTPASLTI